MNLINRDALIMDIKSGDAPRGCYGIDVVNWIMSKHVYEPGLGPRATVTYPKDSKPILITRDKP